MPRPGPFGLNRKPAGAVAADFRHARTHGIGGIQAIYVESDVNRTIAKHAIDLAHDRIGHARAFATERGVYVVLKGDRSVIAAPDGRVWVNPTGSPALATGGTGDVLTGMIAGLVAQFPEQLESALLAAVYLHGRAGELGAAELGEKTLIATDLFEFLPEAMREVADLSH